MGPVYDENGENILTSRRPQLRKKKKDKHSQGMDSPSEIILNDNSNIRRI